MTGSRRRGGFFNSLLVLVGPDGSELPPEYHDGFHDLSLITGRGGVAIRSEIIDPRRDFSIRDPVTGTTWWTHRPPCYPIHTSPWIPETGAFGFYAGTDETNHSVVFPLYPVVAALAVVPGLWFLRRPRRRSLPSACPACGYDLRGSPGIKTCPECGAASASPSGKS